MTDRQIDSVFDITEADAEAAYHMLELTRALLDYAESSDSETFTNKQMLRRYEQETAMMWRQLSVVVADKMEKEITPTDLMEEMTDD